MTISREELEKLDEPHKLTVVEKKERVKKRNERYSEGHKKTIAKTSREWRKKNKMKRITLKVYGIDGYSVKLIQKINKDGKIYGIGWFSEIRTPKEKRLSALRYEIEDVIVLNEYFEDCELHHLAEDVAAFIPVGLHRKVRHNLKTGKNMGLINKIALNFVKEQGFQC